MTISNCEFRFEGVGVTRLISISGFWIFNQRLLTSSPTIRLHPLSCDFSATSCPCGIRMVLDCGGKRSATPLLHARKIVRIAGQLCSLASKKNDLSLAAQTELTLPQLDKLSADVLESTGKRISGLATANLAGLADYGITQTDVTGLDGMTAQFHDAKTAPRKAIATRAGQTKTLPPAVKNVISLLRNQLDKEMLMFKKSNPEFYAGYASARVILDRGGRKGAPQPAPTPAPTAAAK